MLKRWVMVCMLAAFAVGQAAGTPAGSSQPQVIVYYFHTTFRCYSCNVIEKNTGDTLAKRFADEIRSGRLVFKPVNVDERNNRHFVEDYQLFTKAVVLSLVQDGRETRFKNLDKIWQYTRSPGQFAAYIENETAGFLKEL